MFNYRNEVMREDGPDDKTEAPARHALMQTYIDDPPPKTEADGAPTQVSETGGGGLTQID